MLCRRTARCGRPSGAERCDRRRQCCRAQKRLGNIHAFGVFAFHPPGEMSMSFLEHTLRKRDRLFRAPSFQFCRRATQTRHAREDYITERPFVCGSCPFGLHVPFRRKRTSCSLAKIPDPPTPGGNAVKCQNPRRHTKGIPTCRAGNYIGIVNVRPVAVAAVFACSGGRAGCAGSPASQSLCACD